MFIASAVDLSARIGAPWEPDAEDVWPRLQPLYDRLATHAAEWWIAARPDMGELLGYARSVERGPLFELSEFFVTPGSQSAGIGRRLLERAFPEGRGEVRAIIATIDVRAQARYYRAGTAARFPIASLSGPPRPDTRGAAGIEATAATRTDAALLVELEAAVLEYPRDEDEFGWLLSQREGWIYQRRGLPIGFAFVGHSGAGPVAALEPADLVPILLHVEGRAAALGRESLALEVPMVNEVAMRHLLGRGFQIDQFLTLLMSSRPFGHFDRFIGFAPPFVL